MSLAKLFYTYSRAIEFEFSQEKLYKDLFLVTGKSSNVPRSFVYKDFFKKYGTLINIFFWPLILAWNFLLQPLFSLLLLLKYLPGISVAGKKKLAKKIYVELSDIKYFTFISEDEPNYPEQKLVVPFYKTADRFKTNIETIHLNEVVSVVDAIAAYFKNVLLSWRLIFTKQARISLYSYSAYNFILLHHIYKKHSIEHIWLTNHYDRWVVMAASMDKAKLTLVQHGQLDYFHVNTNKTYSSVFPFKLDNVTAVYVHNEASVSLFGDFINAAGCRFGEVTFRNSVVGWRQIDNTCKYKILFIGHTNDALFHSRLIQKLVEQYRSDIDIAYKYHPLQIEKLKQNFIWHITDGLLVPQADLVVSYGSSIDAEFKKLENCRVYNYAYDDNTNIEKVFGEITKELYIISDSKTPRNNIS